MIFFGRTWQKEAAEKALRQLVRYLIEQGYQPWAVESLVTLAIDETLAEKRKREVKVLT